MKKKYKLLIAFAAYTAILCIVGVIAVARVNSLLDEYEEAQPEQLLESTLNDLIFAAREGKDNLQKRMDFSALALYGGEELAGRQLDKFTEKVATANLTAAVRSSTLERLTYAVLADDEPLFYINFKNVATTTKLIIFSTTDWELESVEPVLKTREIVVPNYLSLAYDGKTLKSDAESGDSSSYKINYLMLEGEYTLSDAFGNSVIYNGDALPEVAWWSVTVPSNFKVIAGNIAVGSDYIVANEENADYQYVKEYAEFPTLVTYGFYMLSGDITPTVIDNLGNSVEAEFVNNSARITSQSTLADIPEHIMSVADILEAAHTWSLFMTDDLSGAYHGFYTVAEYLIPDSYLYGVAYAWANGIDITFTSPHTLGAVPFLNESVGDFVVYSDGCFSCNVKFDKHMILDSWQTVMDKMNSTFYFVKSDDGSWRIGDILEIVG